MQRILRLPCKGVRQLFMRIGCKPPPIAYRTTTTTPLVFATRRTIMTTNPVEMAAGEVGVPKQMRANPAFKKINSVEFTSIFTDELIALTNIFEKYGYELRIAGGAVRDILMKIKPKDIDLATTATPEQMKAMFRAEEVRMINTKGEKHGTITPRIHDKENFEVTTLRVDLRTDGRHADVQFTTNWQLDANRRDLTINSMFLGFDGTLYDYFYGYEDVLKRRVLFVGDAATRIKEDYLRIMRYFRFYGRIAEHPQNHNKDILNAIRHNIDGLERISGERIWSELQKIVVGNYNNELVSQMLNCGVLPYCGLPHAPNLLEFRRLCTDLESFPKPHNPIQYMIALLHSPDDARTLHDRLKLSAYERDLALFITQQRDKVDSEYKTLHDFQKLCMHHHARREFVEELLKYTNKLQIYTELKQWKLPHFPLNGNILKERGLPIGRQMGNILNELKLIWADSNFVLTSDKLIEEHLPDVVQKLQDEASPKKKFRKTERQH